jgi:hypothetical protein
MSSNSDRIIHQLHCDFKELIEYVTGEGAQSRTAYEVELNLFRRLLALGAQLLRLFFMHRASARPTEPVYAPDREGDESAPKRPAPHHLGPHRTIKECGLPWRAKTSPSSWLSVWPNGIIWWDSTASSPHRRG